MKTIIIAFTFILLSIQGHTQKNKMVNEVKYNFCDTFYQTRENIIFTEIRCWEIQDSSNVIVYTKTLRNGEILNETYLMNTGLSISRGSSMVTGYTINDSLEISYFLSFYDNGKIMSTYINLWKNHPDEEINGIILFFNKRGRAERMEYYIEGKLVFTQEVAKNWKKSNFDNIKLVPK